MRYLTLNALPHMFDLSLLLIGKNRETIRELLLALLEHFPASTLPIRGLCNIECRIASQNKPIYALKRCAFMLKR